MQDGKVISDLPTEKDTASRHIKTIGVKEARA
jgi:hypothetical protein